MQPVPNIREVFRLTITTLDNVRRLSQDGSLSSLMRFASGLYGQEFPSYDAVRRALNNKGAWCAYVVGPQIEGSSAEANRIPERVDIVKQSLLLFAKENSKQ